MYKSTGTCLKQKLQLHLRVVPEKNLLTCKYMSYKTAVVVSVPLPDHRYSVDIFSYFDPSGILGSDGKQNTA